MVLRVQTVQGVQIRPSYQFDHLVQMVQTILFVQMVQKAHFLLVAQKALMVHLVPMVQKVQEDQRVR